MIQVIATITARPGMREQLLQEMYANIPNVRTEEGCIEYAPMIDTPAGLTAQPPERPDTIVLVERWKSLENLRAHLGAPHMRDYREKVRDWVRETSLQVLAPACR